MRVLAVEKRDPQSWDDAIVRAVHSRCTGILSDPSSGCTSYVESKEERSFDKQSATSPLNDRGSSFEPNEERPRCRTCERCFAYEESISAQLAVKKGRKRPSRPSLVSNLVIDGVKTSISLQHRTSVAAAHVEDSDELAAFSVLAPPVGFERPVDVNSLVFNSAARLHFSMNSLRKLLEKRVQKVLGLVASTEISDHSKDEELWYLAASEFEHLMVSSGVNWMTKQQFELAFLALDANKSGKLHVSELAEAAESAEDDCQRILRREVEPEWVAKKVMTFKPGEQVVGGSLRQLLLKLVEDFQMTDYGIEPSHPGQEIDADNQLPQLRRENAHFSLPDKPTVTFT